jgi:hypothetical protein
MLRLISSLLEFRLQECGLMHLIHVARGISNINTHIHIFLTEWCVTARTSFAPITAVHRSFISTVSMCSRSLHVYKTIYGEL